MDGSILNVLIKQNDKTNNKMKLIDINDLCVIIYLYNYFSFLWIESYMNSFLWNSYRNSNFVLYFLFKFFFCFF